MLIKPQVVPLQDIEGGPRQTSLVVDRLAELKAVPFVCINANISVDVQD